MAISSSDIKFRFSVAAAAGDTTAGSASTSLGDQVATNGPTTAVANNLWDDVSGAEAAAGDVEYRCIFALNDHATLTLIGAQFAIQSQVSGGGLIECGLDTTAISAKGASGAQAVTVANESTAPAGVTFSAGPLAIGDLGPGQVKGIWLRRTVTAGAGAVNDGAVYAVSGDTLP